ncbi:MAG: TSUP family transporter [Rhodocyclaceae bacterium]|nr:TSUP family transporter [Rhodocyclaceae bacterium]MCL4760025.1 TSUP family transporter [Rhodocyclaceae bacterium]
MSSFESIYFFLGLAAFFAGFVDAVVGGGGLIQTPALLAAYPGTAPATLFGTNKLASVVGTFSAAVQYARRVRIPWTIALPGAVAALAGAWLGARAVSVLPGEFLRPLILVLLIAVAVYTFVRKDFGQQGRSTGRSKSADQLVALLIGGGIGFYDGFFGPGTGSFLIFLFIRFCGMDFLHASVTAKIVNVATNLSAIGYFALNVPLLWSLGAVMAVCNLAGAVAGSRMALRHGSGFVRKLFLGVVAVLILKLAYDLTV